MNWKTFEKQVAVFFNGIRHLKKHFGDVATNLLGIECKYRSRNEFQGWYRKLKQELKGTNKVPVICFKEKNMKGFFIVLHCNDEEKYLKARAIERDEGC